jgi:hypothetical protein
MVSVNPLCELLFNSDNGFIYYCANEFCDSWINARSIALMVVVGILLFQMIVLSARHYLLKRSLKMPSNAWILKEKIKEDFEKGGKE